eukprot:1065674-Amphidinium_carterae.1
MMTIADAFAFVLNTVLVHASLLEQETQGCMTSLAVTLTLVLLGQLFQTGTLPVLDSMKFRSLSVTVRNFPHHTAEDRVQATCVT